MWTRADRAAGELASQALTILRLFSDAEGFRLSFGVLTRAHVVRGRSDSQTGGPTPPSESALRKAMDHLRAQLDPVGGRDCVVTVYAEGYLLSGVELLPEAPAGETVLDPEGEPVLLDCPVARLAGRYRVILSSTARLFADRACAARGVPTWMENEIGRVVLLYRLARVGPPPARLVAGRGLAEQGVQPLDALTVDLGFELRVGSVSAAGELRNGERELEVEALARAARMVRRLCGAADDEADE